MQVFMKIKLFNCVPKIIIVSIKHKYFLFFFYFLVDILAADKDYRCVSRGRNLNAMATSYRH